MDDFVKLTIALVFDTPDAKVFADLAAHVTDNKEVQYVAGRESIPHCTLVQAKLALEQTDNAPTGEVRDTSDPRVQKVVLSLSDRLRDLRLDQLVSDVGIYTSKVSVHENDRRVYVGVDLMRTTQLQQAHNGCVGAMKELGGEVTSMCGVQYFPHVTLSYLEPGQQPQDIADRLASLKRNIMSVTPIIGINGDGGRLLEVIAKVPGIHPPQQAQSKRRSFLR
jgi:hypothetical protein